MNHKTVGCLVLLIGMVLVGSNSFAKEVQITVLSQLKGEVLEVEELKEPLGSAIYTVKDLASGATVKFLADKNRSLVKIGDEIKAAGDVLGGSKVTIIYQKTSSQTLPEIVFAKVTNSYS